jgi:serine protease Do
MRKFFSPLIFLGALLLLTVTIPAASARAGQQAPNQRFWTELPAGGHIQKVQSLPDFIDLAAKLSPAVVNISTVESGESEASESGGEGSPFEQFGHPPSKSLGSGFIISKDGYVLTNEHVVENPAKITVTTQDGHNYIAKVVGIDKKTDLALLKIKPDHELAVAPLGNSDGVKVGEWVMAIGNPFGFDHSVTAGIVSAKGRFIPGSIDQPGNLDQYIQTDASINPGNSGGPLIDLRGEVIGVNTAIFTLTRGSMGIGFAIPINVAKDELSQLREHGKVTRGWLGVFIQQLTPDLSSSLGLRDVKGALVAQVIGNSPAAAAGVKRGDVIVSYEGQALTDSRQLPLMVARTPLGRRVMLKIIRDKKPIAVPVVITESHESELAEAATAIPKPALGTQSLFGLRVKDLSPGLARELGVDADSGVVIASVEPGSRADEAGLRARDVILEVNRAAVKNVDGYQKALKAGGKAKNVLLLVKRGDNTTYVVLKPKG